MKIFRFRFTKLTRIMIFAGLALAVAAAAVNTYFLISVGIDSAVNAAYPIIQYSVTYFVAALLLVVLVSLLVSSYYSVDGKYLKTSFGIIKSKYDIENITTVVHDRTNNKLSVYFENNTFIVIVVKEEWYEDFVDEILKVKPSIEFTIKSRENDGTDNDKKA